MKDTTRQLERDLARIPVREPLRPRSAGGGARIVRFTLASVACDDYSETTGTVTAVMCGGGAGVSIGATITLEDPLSFLVGNPQLAIGVAGIAASLNDGAGCAWEITSIGELGYNC